MPSTFNARSAEAYERVMGRWSRRLAGPFLDFAGPPAEGRVLDVGCGTGSLSFLMTERSPALAIDAIDLAEDYVAHARSINDRPGLSFHRGDAGDLPFERDRFDGALALLSLHLMTEPARAVREMVRVTRDGGTLAAAVWDVSGGLPHARLFLDTAAIFDEAGLAVRDRYMRVPLAQDGDLAALFGQMGLRDIEDGMVSVRFDYEDFDDYWHPFLTGEGTMGGYVASLSSADRERLGAHVRAAYLCGRQDGPRSFCATAWVCRGIVAKASS